MTKYDISKTKRSTEKMIINNYIPIHHVNGTISAENISFNNAFGI